MCRVLPSDCASWPIPPSQQAMGGASRPDITVMYHRGGHKGRTGGPEDQETVLQGWESTGKKTLLNEAVGHKLFLSSTVIPLPHYSTPHFPKSWSYVKSYLSLARFYKGCTVFSMHQAVDAQTTTSLHSSLWQGYSWWISSGFHLGNCWRSLTASDSVAQPLATNRSPLAWSDCVSLLPNAWREQYISSEIHQQRNKKK